MSDLIARLRAPYRSYFNLEVDRQMAADRIEQLERQLGGKDDLSQTLVDENEMLREQNKELREALEKAVAAMEAEQRIIPSVRFAEVLPVARAALANKGEK